MLNFQHRYAWLCGAALLLFAQCALPAISFRAAASAAASGATISFRASGAVASANSGNLTARLPAAALGEMFFCQVTSRDNVAHSMPAAWTLAYSLSLSPTLRASLFYKVSAASEVNPLITHPAGGSIIARCTRFRGVDPSNPLDVAFAAQYADSALYCAKRGGRNCVRQHATSYRYCCWALHNAAICKIRKNARTI